MKTKLVNHSYRDDYYPVALLDENDRRYPVELRDENDLVVARFKSETQAREWATRNHHQIVEE